MDHIETVTMIEADLLEQDTDKHKVKEIGRKLAAQDDSSERWSYETIQKCTSRISAQHENLLQRTNNFFGHVFAASGLRQAAPPSGPSHSYDWGTHTRRKI